MRVVTFFLLFSITALIPLRGNAQSETPLPRIAYILGAQKCGTTLLHRLITRHTSVCEGLALVHELQFYGKELHFFDSPSRFSRGKEFYASHFRECKSTKVAIDATPDYFYNFNDAMENMKLTYGLKAFSELKFIVIVKDPVERWISFWNHFRLQKFYKGLNEYSSITNATETLMETSDVTPYLDPNNSCQSEGSCFWVNFLIGGLYGKWLRLWLDRGAHPEQFEIVFLSELVGTKDGTIKTSHFVSRSLIDRLTDFLNITRFPESQVPRLSKQNHHAHLDTIDNDVKERLDRWYAVGNCYFASVVSKHGIRNWTDMMEASSGWIPSPAICERLGFNEIGAFDSEYEALPSEKNEYEYEYNGGSSDAGVLEDAIESEGRYDQGSNANIPDDVVEDITDSEYERSEDDVSGILLLAIFCLTLVFVGWKTAARRKTVGFSSGTYSRVRTRDIDSNDEKRLLQSDDTENRRSF